MGEFIKEVRTDRAPEPIGPYSQAVRCGDLIFISGQIPVIAETGALSAGDIKEQTLTVIGNIREILRSIGLDLDRVVKVEIFLKDIGDFDDVNGVYAAQFDFPVKPARAVVEVSCLPKNAGIEISCTAYDPV